jgi:VCBS repeat-containing protein
MGGVRRWAIMPTLTLIISIVAMVTTTSASASVVKGEGTAVRQYKPPVLAGIERASLRSTAGAPAVRVTSSLTVRSPASATLVGATARVNSGFVAGRDSLGFTKRSGITGSFKASSGVLTLKGSAPTAAYQLALRSVTYRDSDAAAQAGTRKISFQVRDGEPDHALSNVVSRTVVVARVKPPVAHGDAVTIGKNTAINVNVLANDTGPAGLPLTIASVNTAGTKGLVSVNHNQTIRYNPNGQFAGLTQGQDAFDTFTYKATDGSQTSNSATVTVTITGSDDAPVLSKVETTALSYQAGTPAMAVTGTLTVSDDDDVTITSAAVSITFGFDATNDALAFTDQNGIAGSYDADIGVLVLTGSATTADYQAALRSVKFATTDPSANPPARTVTFTVTDSLGVTSAAAARTIDVTQAPQSPVNVHHGPTSGRSGELAP